jgi:hypothetical protein
MVGEELDPEVLLDAGRQRVEAADDEVDIDPAGLLHRLDLARQLRRRGLDEGHARDQVLLGVAVVLERLLQQRQRAADIDDVERDRGFRQRQALWQGRERGDAALDELPACGFHLVIVRHGTLLPLVICDPSGSPCRRWPHPARGCGTGMAPASARRLPRPGGFPYIARRDRL